jgi:hypothetical protein
MAGDVIFTRLFFHCHSYGSCYLMKYFFTSFLGLVLVLLLAAPAVHAQAPAWQTALALDGTTSRVNATAADAAGNIYLTGSFTGTLNLAGTALTSVGGADGFVARYNTRTATFAWALPFGGTGTDQGNALAVAGSNVYVVGTFENTAFFGSLSLSSAGFGDVAVFKLNDLGTAATMAWAQRAGGSAHDEGWALALSGTSVYLGGDIGGAANFGPIALPVTGTSNGFVAKLTDAGTTAAFGWAQLMGGTYFDAIYALVANGTSVYAGGYFSRTATFGNITLASAGQYDGMVVKLTDNGANTSVDWVAPLGGTEFDQVNALALSGTNVYATGQFQNRATFGTAALTSAGGTDCYMAKLADAGASASFVWAQPAGGAGNDFGSALAVSNSNLYVTGGIIGSATFGASTVIGAGGLDVFVARLADAGPSGRFVWGLAGGSSQSDFGVAVALSSQGLYVGGQASTPAFFAPLALPAGGGTNTVLLASLGAMALATAPEASLAALAIVPNPAHGRTTVQLPPGTGPATLTVLNALGRSVRTQTAIGTKAELDLSGLAPGLYAVRLQAGQAIATRRLVVE